MPGMRALREGALPDNQWSVVSCQALSQAVISPFLPLTTDHFSRLLTCNQMVAYTVTVDPVFKALADPTRRLMVDELSERQTQTLYELCVRLTLRHGVTMSRQAIAKHLAILEDAGLVQTSRRGRYRVLAFNEGPIRKISQRWLRRVIGE